MSVVEERLRNVGLKLPPTPKAAGKYVAAVRSGNLLYLSGQIASFDGEVIMSGHLGKELTVEEGYKAAQICGLNALSVIKKELGNFDMVKQVIKVLGWVNSAPGFDQQPLVINGFSDLMIIAFEERGHHARSAVSANELPFGTPVEVEMILEIVGE